MILFISPAYYPTGSIRLPILPICLMEQTYPHWQLMLTHDGPWGGQRSKQFISLLRDPRIITGETNVRKNDYGHPVRHEIMTRLKDPSYMPEVQYIVHTNADNYYMPGFCHLALQTFDSRPRAKVACCQQIIHNYTQWQVMEAKTPLECGSIDIGQCLIRREVAVEFCWPWIDHSSDWTLMDSIARKYGDNSFQRIPACLFVHN